MKRRSHNNLVVVLIAALLTAVVQVALAPWLQVGNARPSLLLATTVALALHFGGWSGLGWGLLSGGMADILAGHAPGVVAIPLALVGYLSGQARAPVLESRFAAPLVAGTLGTLLADLLQALLATLWGYPVILGHLLLYVTFPSALYTGILTVLGFLGLLPVHRLQRRSRLTVHV